MPFEGIKFGIGVNALICIVLMMLASCFVSECQLFKLMIFCQNLRLSCE